MNQPLRTSTIALATLFALAACGEKTAPAQEAASAPAASAPATSAAPAASEPAPGGTASEQDRELLKQAQGIFQPLPSQAEMEKAHPFTEAQVKLGQQLWYEPRLSRGNTVSCNSCHNLATAGVDNMPTS